jgi:O-antigen/teichoic acid export membrane protein
MNVQNPPGQSGNARRLVTRLRGSAGVRAGAILAVATIVLNASAYVYNVACIRYLGSSRYADVAAMLALFALVSLPLGSVQILLAREVAQLPGTGAVAQLLRKSVIRASAVGLVITLAGFALVDPIKAALNVESSAVAIAGLSGILFAVVAAILYGFLQGLLRFRQLSAVYALGGLVRPFLVVPVLLAGLGAAGALAVNTVAGLVAVALCAWGLRDFWTREISDDPVLLDRREVTVLLVGSLAFASLTNVDILLAAYYFPGDVAGVYAAAALVGKAVLFLPAAVVTVLLPKAASRIAAGLTAQKILLASAAATFLIGISATVVLALVPEQLLVWAFGGDFRDATDLLGWFGLAMTAAALVNVYLSVYFAERDARFPLLVLAAAVVQVVVVVAWHPDPRSIVLVTLMCASGILLLHEIAFPHALVRAWRARQLRAAPSG